MAIAAMVAGGSVSQAGAAGSFGADADTGTSSPSSLAASSVGGRDSLAFQGGTVGAAKKKSGKKDTAKGSSKRAARFVIKKSVSTLAAGHGMKLSVKRPYLRGGSAKQRKVVNAAIAKRVEAAKKYVLDWHNGCYDPNNENSGPAELRVFVLSADVYQGRYASVLLDTMMISGCGGVSNQVPYSVNIDLRTRKAFKISRVLAYKSLLRTYNNAVIDRTIQAKNSSCVVDGSYYMELPKNGRRWAVSSKGVTVAYGRYAIAAGACGTVSARASWKLLAKPSDVRGKPVVRTYVKEIKRYPGASSSYDPKWMGGYLIVTQRGNMVWVNWGDLAASGGNSVGKLRGKEIMSGGSDGYLGIKKNSTWKVKGGKAIPAGSGFHEATKSDLAKMKESYVVPKAVM
ncbi:hypothetical protein GCM10010407_13260 [Rarobacter incanus]